MRARRIGGVVGACLLAAGLLALTSGAGGRHASAHRAQAGAYAGAAQHRGVLPSTRTSQQFTSRNWDGYITYAADQGTDFNVVKSTWVQPAVTCPAPNAWAVFWVGLDGWWNATVEQGGSSAQCKNGVPHYALWWEMYPTNAIQLANTISAGDTITASVTYLPGTQVFVIKVKDVTSGVGFTRRETCASGLTCDRSSADVIAEDVGHFSGGYFPLADYGTMTFTPSSITDISGNKGSFTKSTWLNAAVTEQQSGTTYATVSPLRNSGKTFDATWAHQ